VFLGSQRISVVNVYGAVSLQLYDEIWVVVIHWLPHWSCFFLYYWGTRAPLVRGVAKLSVLLRTYAKVSAFWMS
jgi:hypothetical protein